MATLKYSRQRESIKQYLMGRHDHPTADAVYMGVREEFPHISLGTVYRNLSLLSDLGEILKFSVNGVEHFDANVMPHYHFTCRHCHSVLDLDIPHMEGINAEANASFGGIIENHLILFHGLCPDCLTETPEKTN